jgi:hypothetical protein
MNEENILFKKGLSLLESQIHFKNFSSKFVFLQNLIAIQSMGIE